MAVDTQVTFPTRYPVAGVSFSLSILGALWLEERAKLADRASICTYLAGCPAAWDSVSSRLRSSSWRCSWG